MNSSSSKGMSREEEMLLNSSFYCACIMVCLCLIGIFGNTLSIYIFSRKSMRTSSINVLLTGLSIIDLLLVIVIVPIFAVPALNVANSKTVGEFCHIMVVYLYPLGMMLQTGSVWLFMLITTERYLAVVQPLRVGVYCSPSRARLAILSVLSSAVAYNFVRFWEYSLEGQWDGVDQHRRLVSVGLLRESRNYWLWYGTVLYLLTQFLLPFLLISILNTVMVRTIMAAKKQRAMLTISEKSEHRTAIMMVIVVVTFACCYTLSFVLNFIELIDTEFFVRESTQALAFFLNDISNTLVTFNSASTFLVYTVFSRRYRFFVKLLFISTCPQTILRKFVTEETIEAVQMTTLTKDRSMASHSRRTFQTSARSSTAYRSVHNGSPDHAPNVSNAQNRRFIRLLSDGASMEKIKNENGDVQKNRKRNRSATEALLTKCAETASTGELEQSRKLSLEPLPEEETLSLYS